MCVCVCVCVFSFFLLTNVNDHGIFNASPKLHVLSFFPQNESTSKTYLSNQILIHVPSPKPSFKAQLFGSYQKL
jgi:hypothetical protein